MCGKGDTVPVYCFFFIVSFPLEIVRKLFPTLFLSLLFASSQLFASPKFIVRLRLRLRSETDKIGKKSQQICKDTPIKCKKRSSTVISERKSKWVKKCLAGLLKVALSGWLSDQRTEKRRNQKTGGELIWSPNPSRIFSKLLTET